MSKQTNLLSDYINSSNSNGNSSMSMSRRTRAEMSAQRLRPEPLSLTHGSNSLVNAQLLHIRDWTQRHNLERYHARVSSGDTTGDRPSRVHLAQVLDEALSILSVDLLLPEDSDTASSSLPTTTPTFPEYRDGSDQESKQ